MVQHANNCSGKTLAQCAIYFNVPNPQIAWCAWFVRMCGAKDDVNMDFGSSDLASELSGIEGNFQFKAGAQGTTNNKPKVGDLLFIQPVGVTGIAHVGICCEVNPNGNIRSWEGNMSGSTSTSTVKRASYNYNTGESSSWGKIINYGKNS